MSVPKPDSDASDRSKKSSRRWTVVQAILICILLVVIAIPSVFGLFEARKAARRRACKGNLRQIGLALHSYLDQYGSFPPAYVLDADGRKMHSWRVLILPQLGQKDLYAEYRMDEPWDSPHNQKLARRMPDVYECPDAKHSDDGVPSYFAVVDRISAWPGQLGARPRYFYDGMSNSILLVESNELSVNWLDPQDLTLAQARDNAHESVHEGGHNVLTADGEAHLMNSEISPDLYRKLLNIGGNRPYPGAKLPADFVVEGADFGPEIPAENLSNTDIVAHTSDPLVLGRNCVYCATFQIAWDDFSRHTNDQLILEGDPPLAEVLNRSRFPRDGLSEDSFLAIGGSVADGVIEQIRTAVSKKFPEAEPKLLEAYSPDAVVFYSYLRKLLPFAEKYVRFEKPLNFRTSTGVRPVQSFGMEDTSHNSELDTAIRSQVTVLDYVSDEDFVIKLDTIGLRDEIVLAKVRPGATLKDTLDAIRTRIQERSANEDRPHLETEEVLIVPLLVLHARRQYKELVSRHIANTDLFVGMAAQLLRFRLDEAGAHLEVETAIVGENGHGPPPAPPKPRKFILDRPFLIFLQEVDATEPYFVAWIENTELMVEMKK